MNLQKIESPKTTVSTGKLVSKWAVLSRIMRMSAKMNPKTKASHVWQFSPAALAQICMTPSGNGGLFGDEIFRDPANPRLLGCRLEGLCCTNGLRGFIL
jgi:hypothetical protein